MLSSSKFHNSLRLRISFYFYPEPISSCSDTMTWMLLGEAFPCCNFLRIAAWLSLLYSWEQIILSYAKFSCQYSKNGSLAFELWYVWIMNSFESHKEGSRIPFKCVYCTYNWMLYSFRAFGGSRLIVRTRINLCTCFFVSFKSSHTQLYFSYFELFSYPFKIWAF